MEMKNIERLKIIEQDRSSDTGYIVNKERVYIDEDNLRRVTVAGAYDNQNFDRFIIKAILEKEADLLKRAFELEEAHYKEIKRLAKIEAANILAGTELI